VTGTAFPVWGSTRRSAAAVIRLRFPNAVPALEPLAVPADAPDRPFVNPGRDGRLPWPLPFGSWRVSAEVTLRPVERIDWVTPVGDGRVLAGGATSWLLLLSDGGVVAMGQAGGGEQVVDVARGVFFLPAPSGAVEARSLRDGSLRFLVTPAYAGGFRRILIGPDRDRLIVLGVERPRRGHSRRAGLLSVIESFALPESLEAGPGAPVPSAPVRSRLVFPTGRVAAARAGHGWFVAVPNEIVELDRELQPRRLFSGNFVPLSLSVGPGPRLHLVVEAGGRRYYWALTRNGELAISIALPVGAGPVIGPPVLSDEGGAALLLADRILQMHGGGRIAWDRMVGRELEGLPVGATRSADGHLLAAAGRSILAMTPDGAIQSLARVGEPLTSAPILDPAGRLWVAGKSRLLRLEAGR